MNGVVEPALSQFIPSVQTGVGEKCLALGGWAGLKLSTTTAPRYDNFEIFKLCEVLFFRVVTEKHGRLSY